MARIHGVVKHVGGRVGLVWLALALVALDACRSDGGVQPDPDPDPEPEAPPALLLRMEGDTTFSGMAGTAVTVSVRVEDEDGVAHAGILLRGAVTRGEGTVDPSEIRSGEDGGATLQWTFGEGDNDVRVWVDSLPGLETFAHATGLPRVGALRVTVHRYGNADDPDGFLVSALEEELRVAAEESLLFEDVPEGSHAVQLGDVAAHCATTDQEASVDVVAADTADVELVVECYGDLLYGEATSATQSALYYMDTLGATRPLTAPMDGTQRHAAWSPDGTRVVFEQRVGSETDLYLADLEGHTIPLATRAGEKEAGAAWSPDGAWIVYEMSSLRQPIHSELHLVRPDGSEDHAFLASGRFDFSPTWSPDGAFIAFVCWGTPDSICTSRPDGTELTQVPVAVSSPDNVRWSPDGSKIAINDYGAGHQAVRILDVATWSVVESIPDVFTFGAVLWSPDGDRFVVNATNDDGYAWYLVSRDATVALLGAQGVTWIGGWSSDGARIAFGAGDPLSFDLSAADGTERRTVRIEGAQAPVFVLWRPGSAMLGANPYVGSALPPT